VRQRSRWVAGITLQGWQYHGWRAPWNQIYWLWRDRKGLVGNLLSPLTNSIFALSLANWRCLVQLPGWLKAMYAASMAISIVQIGARAACSARIYGWRFATGVPLRILWANVVNALATMGAIRQFAAARRRNSHLAWRKTEHDYPVHATARVGQERFGEFLVRMRLVSPAAVNDALATQPRGVRLGEYLVQLQKLSEEYLYLALSLHAGMELGAPELEDWSRTATRKLPVAAIRRWKVMPYRIDLGQLHLLTPALPTEEMARDLARYCPLELRFRLVRPADFDRLAERFYGERFTEVRLPG
jgi:adsorption protein B